jgi:hypothetical protein
VAVTLPLALGGGVSPVACGVIVTPGCGLAQ